MALTDQDLRLTRAVPAAEWRIPHQQIKHVSLETSFLGKYRGMPALVITFEQAGQLHLATVDTALDSVPDTALPAASLTEHMDRIFSRQQILLLDSYFSVICPPETSTEPGLNVGTAAIF